MFIGERAQRQWIQERIEPGRATSRLSTDQQRRLLQKLTEAEQLERLASEILPHFRKKQGPMTSPPHLNPLPQRGRGQGEGA